ncbi:XRE family transcriptional regulator [Enterococcus faecium]|nr:XRE family transcriptional regulator [Enterococcus faecium]
MDINHGTLIRRLRNERGLTQIQLTKGISQRATLSSLELSGSKISFDILIQYLSRMNVTIEEYTFLYVDYQISDKKKLARHLVQISHKSPEKHESLKILKKKI